MVYISIAVQTIKSKVSGEYIFTYQTSKMFIVWVASVSEYVIIITTLKELTFQALVAT
jgi:hypothetical protein